MDRDDVFGAIRRERGAVPSLFAEFESYPEGAKAHFDLYRLLILAPGPLPRAERERILMEASLANECPYSFRHASQALEFIRETQGETQPSRRQELLSLLAIHVSKEPRRASALRPEFDAAGFTPAEWQQAVMIASYANFANRIAETMDLALEEGFEATCH
ncbi:MAG TPA: hypothetical protein VJB16_02100 [archaeon]|nr:hypothetical protein [archaeon]